MSEDPNTQVETEGRARTTASPTRPPKRRPLFSGGVAAVVAVCCYYAWNSKVDDPMQLFAGQLVFVLAMLPALLWAKREKSQLPVFEVLMITTANTFGVPLMAGAEQLRVFDSETIQSAALAIILYQMAAIGTYAAVGGTPGRSPFYTTEVIGHDIYRYIGYGLVLTTIYTYVSMFTELIPSDLNSMLRAVFFGIGMVSVFAESRRWGLGELKPAERTFFMTNLTAQIVMQFSTLFLVGAISTIVLALVGYVSGSRRLPVIMTIAAFLLLALLHNGKSTMRHKYWSDDIRRQPTLNELPAFFSEWMEASLETGRVETEDTKITAKLLERTSLLHILCLVISYTPDRQPFLGGKTYGDIPGQFVPRFFWHEKPMAHISTTTLSVYYGLQREEDTAKTTIGFGMIGEAYANFGMFGVGVLGCVLGFIYKKVYVRTAASPLLSYPGLFVIMLLAWSFQTEMPASMWLTSLWQACIAVTSIPFLVRNLFG